MNIDPERVKFYRNIWDSLGVPMRPSPEGLDLYRSQMRRFATRHILVMGATPELVDLALELEAATIVSVERNPEIMEAMRQLGRRDWTRVDMIAGDWLDERPAHRAAFNCVVCDGGLLFLEHPGQWRRFFGLIHSYLVPGGAFVAKEWAEPPGQRDYDSMVAEMLASFAAASKGLDGSRRLEAYRVLATDLSLVTMIGATRPDGSFDPGPIIRRRDVLAAQLEQRFPDPDMVWVTRAALKYAGRSRPGAFDLLTGIRYEGAEKLLSASGFRSECHPLPDRPVPDANYMFVARK